MSHISQLQTDALSQPEFARVLQEFMDKTSGTVRLIDLVSVLLPLRRSNLLSYLLKDPTNQVAIGCLHAFVENSPRCISRDFVPRFLSVAGVTINVCPSSFNSNIANKSYVVKLSARSVVPKTKLTLHSYNEIRNRLCEDIANASTEIVSTPSLPTTVKLTMNADTMKSLTNAMVNLHKTIVDGNERQNREVDHYVRSNLRDKC